MFKWIGSIKGFVKEVKTELIKCTWPTRKELYGQSVVVVFVMNNFRSFYSFCVIELILVF